MPLNLVGGDDMSDHYFKKVIKDNSEDKKTKKYDDKGEFDMGYKKDKDCDKDCHKDCHDKCHDEGFSIVDFDVSESTRIIVPTPPPGTVPTIDNLVSVQIDVEDDCSKVLLEGTVEWDPDAISIVGAVLAFLLTGTVGIPLSVTGTFRIWRSTDHCTPVAIFETSDNSPVSALNIIGLLATPTLLSLPFSTTTTSFHYVDENPSCGKNRYFVTLDLSLTDDPTVTIAGVTGLLSSFLPQLNATVETKVLTAIEIKED